MIKVPFSLKEEPTRLEIRKALEVFIQVLNEEYSVPMKEIITELLLFSSNTIACEVIEISECPNYSFDDEDYENEDESQYDLDSAKDSLRYFKDEVKSFKREFKKGEVNEYAMSRLREEIESMLEDFSEKNYKDLLVEVNKLKIELEPMFNEAEIFCAESAIKRIADRMIYNVSSVHSIVSEIEAATLILERKGVFSDELKSIVKLAKERCAKFRAKKKMLDAEIAENSGNITKANKLKAEAYALLMQDWRLIVKSEIIPDISCL